MNDFYFIEIKWDKIEYKWINGVQININKYKKCANKWLYFSIYNEMIVS